MATPSLNDPNLQQMILEQTKLIDASLFTGTHDLEAVRRALTRIEEIVKQHLMPKPIPALPTSPFAPKALVTPPNWSGAVDDSVHTS